MNKGAFAPPTPASVQQRTLVSPYGEVGAPPLNLNCRVALKNVMHNEKRKGNVVGPTTMNFAPFLEDIDSRTTTRPFSVVAGGGKSLPYDPPTFPAALSKGKGRKTGLGFWKRERRTV